jgi:hypothetical protein
MSLAERASAMSSLTVNQLGFDTKLVGINVLLANGATGATIGLRRAAINTCRR